MTGGILSGNTAEKANAFGKRKGREEPRGSWDLRSYMKVGTVVLKFRKGVKPAASREKSA